MQRISPEYLDELPYDLFTYIDGLLQGGVYITDSTGFALDRYGKRRVNMKVIKVKQTVKFHAAVKHYPRSFGKKNTAPEHDVVFVTPAKLM